jgi:8-oxo-dGTP diphosphatase
MNKLSFTPMVVGYIIKNDQVLLGLRKKVSWGLGENLVSGIGGKIGDIPGRESETNEEALVREFEEEIGVIPIKFEEMGVVKFVFPQKPKWNSLVYVYRITEWSGEPVETEVIKPEWYDQDKLPLELMWDDNRLWVPQVINGEKINLEVIYSEDNKTVEEVVKISHDEKKSTAEVTL